MPHRLEVELTSTRDDGSWTWRAAGARQPKGVLDGGLLPEGTKVGDVLRVEAEKYLDGLEITTVFPPKGARKEPERLELLGSGRDEPLVTTRLAEKKRGGGRGKGGRRDRNDRRDGGSGDRGRRRGGRSNDRRDGGSGDRPRPERDQPSRPKPKRLRPARTHRDAAVGQLPDEQKPIAEQLLRGGIPAVRQAVEKQNEAAKAEGLPEVKAGPLLGLAEQIYPPLRTAEWRDKAEAALAGIDDIDLRDIRSTVVAADTAAKDDETRQLADQLREALSARVDREHGEWLSELTEVVNDGRTVRALRLSSRPPKAGAPIPRDLAERLAQQASEGLSPDVSQDRWATVVDAVAYSPVRQQVTPVGIPREPKDELLATIRKLSSRVPEIAALFGIEPSAPTRRRSKGRKKAAAIPPPPDPTGAPPAAATEADPPASPEPVAAPTPPAGDAST